MLLRIAAGSLFCLWLLLVILGKGGFIHTILLTAIGIASVDVMTIYRSRVTG